MRSVEKPILRLGLKPFVSQRHVCELFITGRKWKQPERPSTDEWTSDMWHVDTTERPGEKKEWTPDHAAARMTLRYVLLDYIVYSFPGGGNDDPLQYSCPENSHGQRSLAGYRPRGRKESDVTEWLSVHAHACTHTHTQESFCWTPKTNTTV